MRAARSDESGVWEERWHPLREEWVIVAAHRQHRPWIGATVAATATDAPRYVSDCYLCPGNLRVSGARNPVYADVFVFDNDHPCVGPDAPGPASSAPHSPYRARRANGCARVVCYSPRHDLTLAELSTSEIARVVEVWQAQTRDLQARPQINHVLIFENKGEVVGVSNPHPHGQIYATNFVFKTIETELSAAQRYGRETQAGAAGRYYQGRASRRTANPVRGRACDRLCAVLRALRLRGLRRAQAQRRASPRAQHSRGGGAGARDQGHDGALR